MSISEKINENLINTTNKLTELNSDLEKILYGTDTGGKSYYDEFWDTLQENGNRTDYFYAFAGTSWNKKTFNPKYIIKPSYKQNTLYGGQNIFTNFNWRGYLGNNEGVDFTKFNSMLDFSECAGKSVSRAFENARIKNLEVDLSMCASLSYTFACANGGVIKNLKVKLGESNVGLTTAFYYFLLDFYVIEGSVIASSIDLKRCSGLSLTGAKSVLLALKDFTGTDKANTQTVGLHENAWALLDADGENSPTGTTWREYVLNKAWLT